MSDDKEARSFFILAKLIVDEGMGIMYFAARS
jgi:hypothetical protein